MGTPIKCDVNIQMIYSDSSWQADIDIKGHLEVIWNHRTGDVTDVVGFELSMNCGNDDMDFTTGERSPANNAIWSTVEKLLGDTLINIAQEHCEHEPPTDGSIQEQIDYQENLDDFYPPIPRG